MRTSITSSITSRTRERETVERNQIGRRIVPLVERERKIVLPSLLRLLKRLSVQPITIGSTVMAAVDSLPKSIQRTPVGISRIGSRVGIRITNPSLGSNPKRHKNSAIKGEPKTSCISASRKRRNTLKVRFVVILFLFLTPTLSRLYPVLSSLHSRKGSKTWTWTI